MLKTKHGTTNYKMVKPYLTAAVENGGHIRLESGGYEPLSVEKLGYDFNGHAVFSVMHTYTLNGDMMRDPDITVAVDDEEGRVIPLTYEQSDFGKYEEVFTADGKHYRPALLADLDRFMNQWLKNLKHQGFYEQVKRYEVKTAKPKTSNVWKVYGENHNVKCVLNRSGVAREAAKAIVNAGEERVAIVRNGDGKAVYCCIINEGVFSEYTNRKTLDFVCGVEK